MRATARDPSLGPGGNNRRRVTFYLDVPGDPASEELAVYLAGGGISAAPAAPGGDTGHGRADSGRAHLISGPPARRRSRAQGYVADAAYRRAVELHAMQIAVKHYEEDWDVADTSASNPYDLLLTRPGETRYVEVKGTASPGERINLTANEVEHARSHFGHVVLFIVQDIDVERTDPADPKASGGKQRIIDPFDLDAGDLRPISFTWTTPSS